MKTCETVHLALSAVSGIWKETCVSARIKIFMLKSCKSRRAEHKLTLNLSQGFSSTYRRVIESPLVFNWCWLFRVPKANSFIRSPTYLAHCCWFVLRYGVFHELCFDCYGHLHIHVTLDKINSSVELTTAICFTFHYLLILPTNFTTILRPVNIYETFLDTAPTFWNRHLKHETSILFCFSIQRNQSNKHVFPALLPFIVDLYYRYFTGN